MRALELDFQHPPRPSIFGWVILLAGLAALVALFGSHRMLADETGSRRATIKRIEALLPGAATPTGRNNDAALATARQVMERSKLPWTGLFSALESAGDKDVALLAVTPDVGRRQVKIHGEARHLAGMLEFHRRLQQSEGLSQVVLVDHVISKEAPEKPIRFHIIAAWGVNNGRP
ncbi:MAG TPA: PilN domain-containing protein [Ramlibacter sp.]|nr:PilN domain-containing protein [Ramlibacter sp.]